MQIVQKWSPLEPFLRGAAVALGNFDGVHRGHVKLLQAAHAARPDLPLAVLTFEPHPREFFRPDDPPFRLTLADEKATALAAHGVTLIYQLAFDDTFAAMTAKDFLDNVLDRGIGARHICCGPDFAFGNRRGGDVAVLSNWSEQASIGLTIVPALTDAKGQISSSRIRHLLQGGYPEQAAEELGRPWSLRGVVVHGDARGRQIGFPTANLSLGRHLEPARGVYAVTVACHEMTSFLEFGVANIGRRPTVNGLDTRLEVHLFDFDADLYGKTLDIALISFIRAEKKFPSLQDLKAQIKLDVARSRALLGQAQR